MTYGKTVLLGLGGFVALILFFVLGGDLMPSSDPRMVIEWGMYPEEFEGLAVEIDGEIAGELALFGRATRTVFQVERGIHTVRVIHPDLVCEPFKVDLPLRAQSVQMMLDIQDNYDRKGQPTASIVFR